MKIEQITPFQRELQDFLKALSGETRQKILLAFYGKKELTVNQVSEYTGIAQSTASEHLSQLKRCSLLDSRRDGKLVYYYPCKEKMVEMIDGLKKFLIDCCG